jgi:hypothetical protein
MPPRRLLEIRWSTDDPDALADRLRGHGFEMAADGSIAFPSATIRIVTGAGGKDRIEVEEGAPGVLAASSRPHPNGIDDVVAIGWATVDRERFLADLAPGPNEELSRDAHLGAFTIRHSATGPGQGAAGPGPQVLVLEPDTEGRLVATLVRNAEGPAAIYFAAHRGLDAFVADARRRGAPVSSVQPGPFGPSVVLLGGPPWGPHLLVVARPPGGTIPT